MKASQRLYLMGTVIDLFVEAEQADQLCQVAEDMLHSYHRRFNAHDRLSTVSAINQAAGRHSVVVDEELFELIAWGKAHSDRTLGFLNIALGPVTALWRIGFADAREPDSKELGRALKLTDSRAISLDHREKTVYLNHRGMAIDLGALAKGYAADRIMAYWKGQSVDAAMINLGGNAVVYGRSPLAEDGFWRVGIQDPSSPRGRHLAVLKVRDASVVTSGIYERQLLARGQVFHHIFDGQTGYPITSDIASITLVSRQSLVAETWTTVLFGYSAREAMAKVDSLSGLEGLIVTRDGAVLQSRGLKPYLRI